MNNNNNDLGCLGNAIVTILAFLLVVLFLGGNAALFSGKTEDVGFAVLVAVIADMAIFCWLAIKIAPVIEKKYKNNKADKLAQNKEAVVKEIEKIISYKQEIKQNFDRHFEKIERQYSLVSLISSCMGNNNQELKKMLYHSKEEAFECTRKEIFDELSVEEQKRFPEKLSEAEKYIKTLEQEISELKADLNSVAASDDEKISLMVKKYCPELYKTIKHKKRKKKMIIAAICISVTTIIVLSIITSFGFAFNLAKNYHQSVLKEKLTENYISSCSIYTIEYEKRYKYLDENVTTYSIKDIALKYNNDFSNCSKEELEKLLRHIYRNFSVIITYKWAQHNLSFEPDKYDYKIILIDKNGDRCSYDGNYYNIKN